MKKFEGSHNIILILIYILWRGFSLNNCIEFLKLKSIIQLIFITLY